MAGIVPNPQQKIEATITTAVAAPKPSFNNRVVIGAPEPYIDAIAEAFKKNSRLHVLRFRTDRASEAEGFLAALAGEANALLVVGCVPDVERRMVAKMLQQDTLRIGFVCDRALTDFMDLTEEPRRQIALVAHPDETVGYPWTNRTGCTTTITDIVVGAEKIAKLFVPY